MCKSVVKSFYWSGLRQLVGGGGGGGGGNGGGGVGGGGVWTSGCRFHWRRFSSLEGESRQSELTPATMCLLQKPCLKMTENTQLK